MNCKLFFEFITNHMQEFSLLIAATSALIAAISAIAAFKANQQNKNQYENSIQPQLSMSLVEFNSFLYLRIKNVGQIAAKSVAIRVNCVKNNGSSDELYLDDLFTGEFELYPEEIVQGKVALFGKSLGQYVFPQVDISVSYQAEGAKETTAYKRSVTYLSAYTDKLSADVTLDTKKIEESLRSIARASVRSANYMDGRQVAPFDEINTVSSRSLKADLLDILSKKS